MSVDFDRPPVAEVALGIQFRPLPGLRAIDVAPLREVWRSAYPQVEEQPPLTPAFESQVGAAGMALQVNFGPIQPVRLWFVDNTGERLVQLQQDRLIVNWRKVPRTTGYPRYESLREEFVRRLDDLAGFVGERLQDKIDITQVELSYINVIASDGGPKELSELLSGRSSSRSHHLGPPVQARTTEVYEIPDLGGGISRLYTEAGVTAQPGQVGSELFLSQMIRGAPKDGTLGATLTFLDQAHDHAASSFIELTTEAIREEWGQHDSAG